ncbi:MAG: hypothetical protein Q8M83_04560 [bacterium]|nr:hypothetical protein [bacterium]
MAGHGGGHGGGGSHGGGHESHKSHGGGGHGGGGGGLGLEVLSWAEWKDVFMGDMSRQEKSAAVLSAVALVLGGGLAPAIYAGLAGSEAIEKAMEMLPEEKKGGGGHGGGGKKGGGHH